MVCLQSLQHDSSQPWAGSESSLALGRAHSIPCPLCLALLEHPLLALSVTGLAEREPWSCPSEGVCLLGKCEGGDGWCPRSQSPETRGAPEQSPFLLSLCSALSLLQDQGLLLVWSQLKGCVLLEAFRNCQRGRADFVCSFSSPRSVILHYCITVLKAENEESEEWIPVTFVKNATGRSNLLSLVNTAGFG